MSAKKAKYDFIEWYKLNPMVRADLIPLIEGIREGAQIELWKMEQFKGLEHVIAQSEYLEYSANRLGIVFRNHKRDYYCAKDPAHIDRLWSNEITPGEFLGYPLCCIEMMGKAIQPQSLVNHDQYPGIRFGREMALAIRGNRLDWNLLYLLHIPCGLSCEKSLAMGKRIKETFEETDIEAGAALAEFSMYRTYLFHFQYPPSP